MIRAPRRVDAAWGAVAALASLSSACGGSAPIEKAAADGGAMADATVSDALGADRSAGDAGAELVIPTPVRDGGYIVCENPTPVLVAGRDTGFDECGGGRTLRRRANEACPDSLPQEAGCAVFQGGDGGCHADGDCVSDAGPYATCSYGGGDVCVCVSGCVHDSDCRTGEICACGDAIGRCVPGSCAAGTCPPGSECASNQPCPGDMERFACQTKADTCLTDNDCTPEYGCYVDPGSGVHRCGPVNCGF